MKTTFTLLLLFSTLFFTSCNDSPTNDVPDLGGKTLLLTSNHMVIKNNGELAKFKVQYDGEDVTSSPDLKMYINGSFSSGVTYSSTERKEHWIYASYREVTSNKLRIYVVDSMPRYVKNSALICVTAAWCVYCPLGAGVVEDAMNVYDGRIVPMFFHRYQPGESTKPADPFHIGESVDMTDWLSRGRALPTLRVDNTYDINGNSAPEEFISSLEMGGVEGAKLGLSIDSKYDKATRTLAYTIRSTQRHDMTDKKLMMVAWITENGMVSPQAHFKQGVINSYVHKNVVRASLFKEGCVGVELPKDCLVSQGEYVVSGEYVVAEGFDPENMYLNAYIYDFDGNNTVYHQILNTQRVRFGDSRPYLYMTN